MEPTSTSAGGIFALKATFIQAIIASLAGVLGFILIRPRTVREAVWRFLGAAISSVIFGPLVVAAIHSFWPSLLASANTLAQGDGIGFTALYFTAPIQIASGLPIWWLLGLGARWMESNQGLDLPQFFGPLNSGKMALLRKGRADEKEPIHRGADGRHPP